MFFEDEKDIIKDGADIRIDEDGTVTWEDVLDSQTDIPGLDDTSKTSTTNLGDELELVQQEDVDDIDDQELMQILNNTQSDVYQTETTVAPQNTAEDFDIDSQLANVVLEQNKSEEQTNYKPRKAEKKPASNTPMLLALLFIIVLAGGGYYLWGYIQENELLSPVSQNNIEPRPSVQEEMNNITQEELAQRQAQENIPVINEEEANELQSEEAQKEEEKKEEKKQVVKVIPTGRINPFMPTSKYASTSIPVTSIMYDKSGVPKPPEEYGIKDEETTRMMTIAVSGIMYDEIKPSAIITYDNNDYFVQKGDKLDNYKIVEIAKNHVMISLGSNIYRANIGEEFKISSEFYGSAQYIPQKQGGGRQYHSVSDNPEQSNTTSDKGLRYVSEDDITIKAK